MSNTDTTIYRKIIKDGLWHNNPGLVQLLGLCPLMAVTTNFINGFGLGIATLVALVASNVAIAIVRHWIRPEIRIPVFVLIIAANVTLIELLMNAYFHELYNVLGLFIALIVTNCIVIGRAEIFASKNTPLHTLLDSTMMGLGFMLVLCVLGGLRELIAQGTLFSQAHLMFGESAKALTLTLGANYHGMLLAALPPGAFIGLGFLVALKNGIDTYLKQRSKTTPLKTAPLTTGEVA
ncbi:electron transport complex subunit E [Thiofilum flexile]|uniref:electron transport complex subunit E n=1 Tax=Thiofilum flexile TaxID=125627 RepID=UPI00036355D3|nr:electron transport complex subunit E [Thiofilum flexile]